MGAGRTLTAALHALRSRHEAMPRGRSLFAAVLQVIMSALRRGQPITEVSMLDVTEAEEYMRQQHAEGLQEGLRLLRGVERKLARVLTDPEWEALTRKLKSDGALAVDHTLTSLDPDALARWLVTPRG
jgi:hypothetical protein